MVIYGIFISLAFLVGGLMLYKHGLTLPTAENDTDCDDSFIYEFFFGPPGYKRARGIFGGMVLMLVGFGCLIYWVIKLF